MKVTLNQPEKTITVYFDVKKHEIKHNSLRRRIYYFCKGWASLGNIYGDMPRDRSRYQ